MTNAIDNIHITPIPIRQDNYVWVISHRMHSGVFIVDPGDATEVIEYLENDGSALKGILITHSHNDHIGGIDALLEVFPTPVYGPRCDRIPQITHYLGNNDVLELWEDCQCRIMHTPGHLPEHIVYFIESPSLSTPVLMCADIIFSSGCGRMFVGTPQEFKQSLDKIAKLPDETRLYPAHEYTLANIDFALHVEPDNKDLLKKRDETHWRLKQHGCSLPTTIESESLTNPFLRCGRDDIKKRINELFTFDTTPILDDETAVFAALRKLKDTF